MKIEKFVTGIISTNCYIVTNEETKETVIVDPANLSKAMIGYIEEEELVIKAILLTHAHFDHIMGIDKVIDRYGEMPVYVEESDLELLHTPSMNESTVYTNGYSYPGGDVIHDGRRFPGDPYTGTYPGRRMLLCRKRGSTFQWRYIVLLFSRKK